MELHEASTLPPAPARPDAIVNCSSQGGVMGTAGLRAYSNRQSTIAKMMLSAVQALEQSSVIALAPCMLHSEIWPSQFGIAVQVPELGKLAVSADREEHRGRHFRIPRMLHRLSRDLRSDNFSMQQN